MTETHSPITDWQTLPAKSLKEAHEQITGAFQNTYQQTFADAWMGVNRNLSVELRGFKYVEGWVTGFLLTPWMLANIYMPLQVPPIEVEVDWTAQARQNQNYVVIGPLKSFELAGKFLKGNLNYDAQLGHYLLQPLVQVMDKYDSNEAAFAAWAQVIQFKQDYYAKLEAEQLAAEQLAQASQAEQEAALNQPSSRRDFLSKWRV